MFASTFRENLLQKKEGKTAKLYEKNFSTSNN